MRRSGSRSHRSKGSVLQLLRDTAMVRRRSRQARIGAALVATAATLVLVSGMAPVYADGDTGTDTSATSSADTGAATDGQKASTTKPADESTGTDDATTSTDEQTSEAAAQPSDEPSPTTSVAPEPADSAQDSGADSGSATTTKPGTETKKTSTKTTESAKTADSGTQQPTLTSALALPLAITVECVGGPASVIGGFEIDGNLCAQGNLDWATTGASIDDGFGDSSGFTQGDAENKDPSTWHTGHTPNGKSDIGNFWAYSHVSGGHVYGYFGLTNTSTSGGTGKFDLEYNQAGNQLNANGLAAPVRTPGDLLFQFSGNGSAPVSFDDAKRYTLTGDPDWGSGCFAVTDSSPTGGWCDIPTPTAAFASQTNDDGTFIEGAIDLTILFGAGGDCSGTFGTVQVRSITGNSFDTASLMDFVTPLGVDTPSTCSTIVIKKFRAGTSTLLTGAHFDVYEGDSATGTPLFSDVTDGGSLDTDDVAGQITLADIEPGTYTVKETQAPAGYFLPADPVQTVDVGESTTVTFDFHDVKKWQALTATKDGSGSYDAKYAWSIEKGVATPGSNAYQDSLTRSVQDDGDGDTATSFSYRVEVTEGARTITNAKVTGNITVHNPNDEPVTVDLSDQLDGAQCTITGGAEDRTAAADGDTDFGYTCTYADGTDPATFDETNVATVSWDKSTYPQTAGDIAADGDYSATTDPTAITYTEHATDKTVTVTDDHHTFDPAWTISWTAEGTVSAKSYTRSLSAPAGQCTSEKNTASVHGDTAVLDSDDATATVCVGADLSVSKVSTESLTRTYLWTIDKTSDDAGRLYTDPATGKVMTDWSVTVAAGDKQDSGWLMSGDITVANPNQWQSVILTGLSDVYSGGGTCTITGWDTMTDADKRIPKATAGGPGTKTFPYTCEFTSQPDYDGTNTATATWDRIAEHTPSGTGSGSVAVGEGDWQLDREVNKQVTVTDGVIGNGDPEQIGDTYTWSPGFSTTIDYQVELGADPGKCTTWTNVATLHGDGGSALDSADASVEICNKQALTISKSASGKFDRTYHWSLDKYVSADGSTPTQGTARWGGDDMSHTFGYRVLLSQLPWSDDNFTMTGTIRLTNPNSDTSIPGVSSTITEVPDLGDATATCVVNGGDDDGASLGGTGYTTPEIASGDTLLVGYRCTVTGTPGQTDGSYTGTNTVTATNTAAGSASKEFTFVKDGEIDKTVHVYDDKVTHTDDPVELGSGVSYDESDPDATYHWDYSLTHTATAAQCQDFTNHAAVFGDGLTALDNAEATATVCPTPGTWTVSKTSSADGAVPVGSTIAYTLGAQKTSTVNPTDVVLVDDLTPLAAHADLPTESELQAAAPAGTTVTLSGTEVTWTIAELDADLTLAFDVVVHDDAYGVDLPNLVTSAGSENCPDPQTAAAQDECTTDSDTPHYTLTKSSDPVSGTAVAPHDTITYTLTVHNDSDAAINGTTMPGATVTDDLSDVLDDATLVDGSIDPAGQASVSGTTLTWTLPEIGAGQDAVLTYQVTVNDDAWGATIGNLASPGDGGECVQSCTTTQYTPHWTLAKSSDPAPGATVQPGDAITYTLTLHNDGPVALAGPKVTDDLSDVVDNATLDESSFVGPGDVSYDDATGSLTWQPGPVALDGTVTLQYTVTVDDGEWGETLHNVATPTGGGECVESCTTTQYTPHWTLTKTSDPASGATVQPGDAITYTLSVHNDGPVTVSGVTVTDDLSDVLDDATLQTPLAAGLSQPDATTLQWAVPDLAPDQTLTVSYTVTLDEDAWGATVRNNATPDQPSGECEESCTTTDYSPHWTLTKTSDPATGSTVQPPYLGDPGDVVTYTLTAHNDGPIPVAGATAVDDLSDVLDDATVVTPLDDALELSGSTLTWAVPTMQPGDTVTVSYQVRVDADRWDQTLTNVVTPGQPSGECVESCTTTTDTPSATRMQVKKVNAETGAGLAGAEFTLYQDNAPFADPSDPTVGAEDEEIGTATSGDDGIAGFTPWLRPGHFLVKETAAPEGYALPVTGDTMARVVDDSNFVAGDYMSPFEFRDPAEGQLAIVAKEQFEKDPATGLWLPSDGVVSYGDEVRYVVKVSATGPKLFHDVTLTDYVPGHNPDDTTSTGTGTLVPGSATCTGDITCTVSVAADGLVTWKLGTVTSAEGAVEMVVRFPGLPQPVPYVDGSYTTTLWNAAYLDWDEASFALTQQESTDAVAGTADPAIGMVHHQLTSNEVTVKATVFETLPPVVTPPVVTPPQVEPPAVTPPQVQPPQAAPQPPTALPNTGGPEAWLPLTGIGLLVAGAALVASRERRRRREV